MDTRLYKGFVRNPKGTEIIYSVKNEPIKGEWIIGTKKEVEAKTSKEEMCYPQFMESYDRPYVDSKGNPIFLGDQVYDKEFNSTTYCLNDIFFEEHFSKKNSKVAKLIDVEITHKHINNLSFVKQFQEITEYYFPSWYDEQELLWENDLWDVEE